MPKQIDTLRVVVFAEGDAWLAQALELDVCAQASSPDEVREVFLATLECELSMAAKAGQQPETSIGPAPSQYFAMWDQRSQFSCTVKLQDDDDGHVELALCA